MKGQNAYAKTAMHRDGSLDHCNAMLVSPESKGLSPLTELEGFVTKMNLILS